MAARRRQLQREPQTVNELFFDAMIRHQIGTLRVAGGIRDRVLRLLDATESDIRRAIRDRLRANVGLETPAQVRRLRRLLDEIRKIRGTAWSQVDDVWRNDLFALAKLEPQFVDSILKTVVPVQLSTTLPDAGRLRAIVTSKPFHGKILKDWAKDVRVADLDRIESQIQIGLVQGESVPEISRRVVGSVRLRGRNGVTEITRRNAAMLTRTAANHVANQARAEYFRANRRFFEFELFVATLDSRTTPVCRANDGKRFRPDRGPRPPLHPNCRSLRTALVDPDPLGFRPSKPVHKRQLLREFAKREGLDSVPRLRSDLPRGTKGAFDEFSRRRTREMTGRVLAKVDYQTWLGRQSAMFQDDVLGKTKGRLFRRGGLRLDRFIDRAGNEKTLLQLARDEAAAFRAAGLDPEDFLR